MEDSAGGSLTSQKVIHLKDEEQQKATGELHGKVSGEYNKTGLPPITPQDVDPHHETILEEVNELAQDAMRVGKQTFREATVGSHHTNIARVTNPYSMEVEKANKRAGENLKKAA